MTRRLVLLAVLVMAALTVACQFLPGQQAGSALPTPKGGLQPLPGFDEYYWNPAAFGLQPPSTLGGQVRYAVTQLPVSFDPTVDASAASLGLLSSTYDSLVATRVAPGINPLDSTLICRLCEKWTAEPDRVTWTIGLRQGVTWHDGRPFTAADVEATVNRLRNPRVNSGGAAVPAAALAGVARVTVVDPQTVQFVTREPQAAFIDGLEDMWIVPAHVYAGPDDTEALKGRAIGTGPFRLAAADPAADLVLEKNAAYWVPNRPYLDRLLVALLPERAARSAALQAKTLDMGVITDVTELEPVKRSVPNLGVQSYQSILVTGIEMNTRRRPWDSVDVRRALSWAFDRDLMNQQLTAGTGRGVFQAPMTSNLRPWTLPREELLRFPGYDPARKAADRQLAKDALARAGFPNGLTAELKLCRGATPATALADLAAAQSPSVGITLRLAPVDAAPCQQQRDRSEFELLMAPTRGNLPPDLAYGALVTGNPQNVWGIADPDYDVLYREARSEFDVPRRQERYRALQRIALERAYLVALIDLQPQFTWLPRVHNAREYSLGTQSYPRQGSAEVIWADKP